MILVKVLRSIAIILIVLLCVTCKKKNKTYGGKLTNVTFSGCGWMIKLDEQDTNGNDMVQPLNLSDFSVTLAEGQHVEVAYRYKDAANACSVGRTATIDSIKDN